MKIPVKKTIWSDVSFSGIKLLSLEEFQRLKGNIPLLRDWWWLSSPGICEGLAAIVNIDGTDDPYGDNVDSKAAVRPVLLIPDTKGLDIGDTLTVANRTWTYIGDGYALCDSRIGNECFRENWRGKDTNDYEKSDIKVFIENWYKGNIPDGSHEIRI